MLYPTGQLIILKVCVPHLTIPLLSSVNPLFSSILSTLALCRLIHFSSGRYSLAAVISLLATEHTTSQQKIYVWFAARASYFKQVCTFSWFILCIVSSESNLQLDLSSPFLFSIAHFVCLCQADAIVNCWRVLSVTKCGAFVLTLSHDINPSLLVSQSQTYLTSSCVSMLLIHRLWISVL